MNGTASTSTAEILLTIAGLVAITLVTRAFFLLPRRPLPIPGWLNEGLKYAPLGALAALIAPDVLMAQGRIVSTLAEPRVLGAIAGAAYWLLRRGMLGTIVVGTATMMAFKLGLGW